MPENNDPENEIGTHADEPKLGRLEAVGLLAAVLLLMALLWVLIDVSPGLW
ncbi:MAG: hypothetical protein ACK4TP_13560 [Hyphomicrobium sp.]